jgi:alanine-glyoxylate transaminase/serine-glyoxylate transaminase/serine-pyruvate transaminase
MVHACVATCQ